ncbi:MAG: hypothetical protein V7711_01915 [Pseudomonadales bacterium]
MKKFVIFAAAACLSASVFAAKPTKVSFDSYGTAEDGTEYATYIVKCSNGKKLPLTAWDNRKQWCVGEESKENCEKKQLNAAKKACKLR